MELGIQSQTHIQNALKTALEKLAASGQATVITDIYLQPCMGDAELAIFDDDDHELARVAVNEWAGCVPESFYPEVTQQLSDVLGRLEQEGALAAVTLMKPYSFVLVDDERETIADLLLVDDDTMLLRDGLLKGLDEELDAFLKQLLEE